jgi:hypothetical protein
MTTFGCGYSSFYIFDAAQIDNRAKVMSQLLVKKIQDIQFF